MSPLAQSPYFDNSDVCFYIPAVLPLQGGDVYAPFEEHSQQCSYSYSRTVFDKDMTERDPCFDDSDFSAEQSSPQVSSPLQKHSCFYTLAGFARDYLE